MPVVLLGMSRTLFEISQTGNSAIGALSLLSKRTARCEQRRTIVLKEHLQLPDNYPEPWDYRTKGYSWLHIFMDWTKKRIHENSKLIVVEGNIGSGKSAVAEEIADRLGFHFMPAFKMDDVLVDRYGNDFRDYYHLFPKRFRIPDANLFYKNPYDELSAVYQDRMYFCRHEQYMNALTHIANTGQGVVLENSVYGDFVFTNAMRQKNFIGPEYFNHYYYVRRRSLLPLTLYPHLVVYLDVPIERCLETIQRRGNTDEINVCDAEYLGTIADSYRDMLNEMNVVNTEDWVNQYDTIISCRTHSHVLAYDCAKEEITSDRIVDDITNMIEFDFYEWHSSDICREWFLLNGEIYWTHWRCYITDKIAPRRRSFDGIRHHEVGELYIYPPDAAHYIHVMQKEVLKSDHGYGFQKQDDILNSMLSITFKPKDATQPWTEYFFRDTCYNNLACASAILDPYCNNYNPDYLHGHH